MVGILIMTVIFYLVKSGTQTLGKWSFLMLFAVMTFVMITIILSLCCFDLKNIFPIMGHKPTSILKSSLETLAFPFAEIVLFLSISDSLQKNSKPKKMFLLALFIGGFVLIIAFFRNLTILGQSMVDNTFFSSYTTTRIIGIPGSVERVENLITTNFILAGIGKISVCLMSASKGAAKLFNIKEYNRIILPIGLLILALSTMVVSDTMDMFSSLPKYKYYSLPIQIVIPLIVWITAEVKHKLAKNKSNNAPSKQ